MRKLLLLLLLLATPAQAADNYTATAGTGLTFAAKDVAGGGILYPWWIPANSAGVEIFTAVTPGKVDPGTPANWGVGATAAAVPARAVYMGIISGGNLVGWTGSVSVSALPANASINLAQVNAVTTSTGAGATGTGTQRVGVAQDTTTIAGAAPGTAGTPSTNVVSVQGEASMTPIAASQSGTWTVQPGNTANTTAWKVDGSRSPSR